MCRKLNIPVIKEEFKIISRNCVRRVKTENEPRLAKDTSSKTGYLSAMETKKKAKESSSQQEKGKLTISRTSVLLLSLFSQKGNGALVAIGKIRGLWFRRNKKGIKENLH